MKYEPKRFEHLLGTKGFRDQLLKNHFLLYQGYVTNTNKLRERLNQLVQDGKTGTAEYAKLKRRFGWNAQIISRSFSRRSTGKRFWGDLRFNEKR